MIDLPEEILSEICSYFQLSANLTFDGQAVQRNALASLRLACRELSRIARPYWFHTLFVENPTDVRVALELLVESPQTARLVKQIHTESWIPASYQAASGEQPQPIPTSSRTNLLTIVDDLGIGAGVKHSIRNGIERGFEDAEHTLLFLMCENIQLWSLAMAPEFPDTLIREIVSEPAAGQPDRSSPVSRVPLQQLQTLKVYYFDVDHYNQLHEVFPMLALPALRRFEGSSMDGRDVVLLRRLSETVRSKVEHIELTASIIGGEALEALLKICPDLKRLRIEQGGDLAPWSEEGYDKMSKALNVYGRKISTMWLSEDHNCDYFYRAPSHAEVQVSPLGDIRGMVSLRILWLPLSALFGRGSETERSRPSDWLQRTLPSSLVTLVINDTSSGDEGVEVLKSRGSKVFQLMGDPRFSQLSSIRWYHNKLPFALPFTWNADEVGWDDSRFTDTCIWFEHPGRPPLVGDLWVNPMY